MRAPHQAAVGVLPVRLPSLMPPWQSHYALRLSGIGRSVCVGWLAVPLILAHRSRGQGLRAPGALASWRPSLNPDSCAAACRFRSGCSPVGCGPRGRHRKPFSIATRVLLGSLPTSVSELNSARGGHAAEVSRYQSRWPGFGMKPGAQPANPAAGRVSHARQIPRPAHIPGTPAIRAL